MKPLLTFLFFALAATASVASSLPGFDFAYEIGGARKIAPIQIFDDGMRTYIQWPTSISVGTVNVSLDGRNRKPLAGATPYYVVEGVGQMIEIRSGEAIARASYVGERGKAPMQVAQSAKPVIEAQRQAHVAARVATEIQHWEVHATDRTLEATLRRWAKASGYTLNWRVVDQLMVERGATYKGSLPEVLAQVAKEVSIVIEIDGVNIIATDAEVQ
jgi:Toxin co-regulated pilus biosynthesis protein Q